MAEWHNLDQGTPEVKSVAWRSDSLLLRPRVWLQSSLIRYFMPVYPGASLITLFACASRSTGIVKPICFAALRFIKAPNFNLT